MEGTLYLNFPRWTYPMPAEFTLRPVLLETDLPGITRLINCFEDRPVSEFDVGTWIQEYSRPEYHTLRLVALDDQGAIFGYARVLHDVTAPEGHFRGWVGVEPQRWGQGAGSALWAALLVYLQEQLAARIVTEVKETDAISLAFAQRRGFAIQRHSFSSSLDLEAFDAAPFLPSLAAVEGQGIRFCALADFADTPETRQKLYELNWTTAMDIPGVDELPWTLAEFERFIIGASWFDPLGQLLALDGEDWVALAGVSLDREDRSAYNAYTGVARSHRGRGIGQAMKLRAVLYARENGAVKLSTENDSHNASILKINRAMGYRPEPGKYFLAADLSSAAALDPLSHAAAPEN
jgi:GNAT superfamily N-acetyltransferase